ncbi:AcrR family transcriptional regulator [Rhodoblastus sphagnicola]|uniref:TetR/AcrR family transcriptional regulator n=1 Tax=Rhodoblastus sphagnicola TaxID=333368 RepID=UPI001622ABFD|nr:TetR/AcrR family transcriptional regulator [Rhodoblastus sphagnicola]MBB4199145.1 AcrR family transcriptional regulator [Rhodoblastus sphagnicola]
MGRRSYHHGRLREALLTAARALISERGLAGFTLAEAAKRVGVTGAAPYRHFADRDALVAALAQDGFTHFNAQLGRAWDGGKPDPVAALRRRCEAYLDFARAEPGLYRAMFGDAGPARRPTENAAARTTFEDLVRSTVEVLRYFHAPEGDAETLGVQIWAMSHGVADLMLGGHFSDRPDEAFHVLGAGVAALVEGALRASLGVKPVFPAF